MWLRWCALGMMLGLGLVVTGLLVAVNAQMAVVDCGAACLGADGRRLAVELSLVGVIVSSLSTAGVAAALMRTARPRMARPPPVRAPSPARPRAPTEPAAPPVPAGPPR